MAKEKKSIQSVVAKELPEFASACEGLTTAEIFARLVQNAKDWEEVADSEDNDEEFLAAKESVKERSAPYRDIKKALKLKRRYLISLLADRGAV